MQPINIHCTDCIMIKISLTDDDKSALERLRLHHTSNIGERAYMVLLSSEGHSPPVIAKRMGRNSHTVRLWLGRYLSDGLAGLRNHAKPGRPGVKASILEASLESLLNQSPQELGYQEAGWQINLLCDWFQQNKSLSVCHRTVSSALTKTGYVHKRISKSMPNHAPSAEEKHQKIAEITSSIRQIKNEDTEILFVDESHFSNQPYVNRGWFKKGKKKGSHT